MRQPIVVANWKMHTNLSDAIVLTQSIKDELSNLSAIEVVIAPPSIWLVPIAEIISNHPLQNLSLAAQNIYFEEEGNYTGEISPKQVKNIVKYTIVGHSERRRFFAETDSMINQKVLACLDNKISPIICVGEYKRSSKIDPEIFKQLRSSLNKIRSQEVEKVVIAYEPVWAIGTGIPALGVYAAKVIGEIRERLGNIYGAHLASLIRILYGGSVDSKNVSEFVLQPEIDGVLVGTASLKAREFIKICQIVAGK